MEMNEEEYYKMKECIKDWIISINNEEKLPEDIVAINFGLFEPYGIELIGSKEYDEEDDDWACEEDFVPKDRECPHFEIRDDFEWEYVLEIVTKILKEIVAESKNIDVLNVEHITTGFCDGDLVIIK